MSYNLQNSDIANFYILIAHICNIRLPSPEDRKLERNSILDYVNVVSTPAATGITEHTRLPERSSNTRHIHYQHLLAAKQFKHESTSAGIYILTLILSSTQLCSSAIKVWLDSRWNNQFVMSLGDGSLPLSWKHVLPEAMREDKRII